MSAISTATLNSVPNDVLKIILEMAGNNPEHRKVSKLFKSIIDSSFNLIFNKLATTDVPFLSGVFARFGGVFNLTASVQLIQTFHPNKTSLEKLGRLKSMWGIKQGFLGLIKTLSPDALAQHLYTITINRIPKEFLQTAISHLPADRQQDLFFNIWVLSNAPLGEHNYGQLHACDHVETLEKALIQSGIQQL